MTEKMEKKNLILVAQCSEIYGNPFLSAHGRYPLKSLKSHCTKSCMEKASLCLLDYFQMVLG